MIHERGFIKNVHTTVAKQLHNSEIRNAVFSAFVFLIVANPIVFKFVGKIVKVKDQNTLLLIHAVVFATIMYFGSLYIFEPVRRLLFNFKEGFDGAHTHAPGPAVPTAPVPAAPRPGQASPSVPVTRPGQAPRPGLAPRPGQAPRPGPVPRAAGPVPQAAGPGPQPVGPPAGPVPQPVGPPAGPSDPAPVGQNP